MKVEIRTKGFSLTSGLRSHTERRLAFAMDRFLRRISTVLVSMGDVNGPKGGVDKSCRVTVVLIRGRVILEERSPDLYVAIDRAVNRAAERVAREVKRFNRPASPRWVRAGEEVQIEAAS